MTRPLKVGDEHLLQAALRRERNHSAHARYVDRLICLLLVGRGHTCYEVASCLGQSPRAVERWVHRFEAEGPDGLKERARAAGSGSRTLTARQVASVASDVARSPRVLGYEARSWTGPLLARHLGNEYHVTLSVRHCQRLLRPSTCSRRPPGR
jgi:transposase